MTHLYLACLVRTRHSSHAHSPTHAEHAPRPQGLSQVTDSYRHDSFISCMPPLYLTLLSCALTRHAQVKKRSGDNAEVMLRTIDSEHFKYQIMMTEAIAKVRLCVAVRCHVGQCGAVRCSALQCVAVRCSALQCVAVRCSALQCVAVRCSALQFAAVRCSVLQCAAVCCSALRCVAMRCDALRCVAVRCSALQCVAVRCSALQCISVRCSAL